MKRIFLLVLLIAGLIFSLSGCSLFNQGPDIQNWQPVTSPDGTEMIFSTKVDGNFQLIWFDPETKERKQITQNDYDDWGPDWGPEGERIVFVSKRNDNTDIYAVDVDGSEETRLTTNSSQDVNPRWSGTSKVVFNSDRTGSWEIFTVSLPDKSINQVTSSASEEGKEG